MSAANAGTSLLLNMGGRRIVKEQVVYLDGDPTNTSPSNLDIVEAVDEWTWLAVVDLVFFVERVLPVKTLGDIETKYLGPGLLDNTDQARADALNGVLAGTHLLFEFKQERPGRDTQAGVEIAAWMMFHNLRRAQALRAYHETLSSSVPEAKVSRGFSADIGPSIVLPT